MASKRELKKQNPDYTIDLIEVLSKNDPTDTNKYLPFMINKTGEWVNWLINEVNNETFKQMFELVRDFEDLSSRNLLENKDIYSYEDSDDLIEAINFAKERVTRSEVKKKETEVIHEDERWLVILPLTHRSSNMYGKSTKWCVAGDDQDYARYFNQYTEDGILVYVIDKSIKEKETRDNPLSKVAFHNYFNKKEDVTAWDSKDAKLSVKDMMKLINLVGTDIMAKVDELLESGVSTKTRAKEKGLKVE
jgi:hypothetical protein